MGCRYPTSAAVLRLLSASYFSLLQKASKFGAAVSLSVRYRSRQSALARAYCFSSAFLRFIRIWIVFTSENEEETMSRSVYCYDGSGWTVLEDLAFVGRHNVQEKVENGYIQAGCVPSEYGLLMLNCSTEGGGSFFIYDPETGEYQPLYLTLRDGRSDALNASAVMAGGSVYTLLNVQSLDDPPFAVKLYRIPYRNLYQTAASYLHIIGDSNPIVMTAKRTAADWLTYDRFRRLTVDGVTVDPKYYRTEPGSLALTLSPEYLDTLAVGEHPAVLSFTDGTAETSIVITKPVPKTGDDASSTWWILCICMGLVMLPIRFSDKPPDD